MKDKIELIPVKCNRCGEEFFIMKEPQTLTCPGCGVEEEVDIVSISDDELKAYITRELQDEGTQHYIEAGYLNWFHVFGDADGYDIEERMREIMTHEEAEEIWQQAHK